VITAVLSPNGKRIDVRFPFDHSLTQRIKAIPGARFIGPEKPEGPCWRLPLDMHTGRALRAAAPTVQLAPTLKAWGAAERAREQQLGELARATDNRLPRLQQAAPALRMYLRPYQRTDAAFMTARGDCLNANAPGVGKTIETIASIYDHCGDAGLHLIVAGITSMDVVWGDELRRWSPRVWLARGSIAQRKATIDRAFRNWGTERAAFLVVNPAMLQLVAIKDQDDLGQLVVVGYEERWPELFEPNWDTVVFDEFHTMGLTNKSTLTRKGIDRLNASRRIVLSGTPIGGQPIKLWGVLNYLYPQVFTSKWRWAEQWLEMEPNQHAYGGQAIGHRIKPGLEDAFAEYHATYMVRRSKHDVRPDLPEKNVIELWVTLEGKQAKQYAEFDAQAELRIGDRIIDATSILAEYTRLRQLASATCTIANDTLWPQPRSAKLDQLVRILADHGIAKERDGREQAVVFTQFTRLANVVAAELAKLGLNVALLTGETKAEDRARIIRDFEGLGAIDVLVMNTKAGGTALTLNASSAIIFLDETWNPDDQLQAEERNRNNSADIYYIRARGTIDEDVYQVTGGKQFVNATILDKIRDLRRSSRGLGADRGA
jgi:SNF2 family DNA or RNA helicase